MNWKSDFAEVMNPPVFLGSAGVIAAFCLYGALLSSHAAAMFDNIQTVIISRFGWFYVLAATGLLVFVVWLGLSRYGGIRLGGDDAQPDFGRLTWFSMLLAAGMGIGLVFFGVAEPVMHFVNPLDAGSRSEAAMREAMFHSFFHWGLHPWAIYIAFALPLAYFHFRHGLPMAPRTLLFPLLGERIHGTVGHVVDIVSTVATLFGVGTSLGLGAMQINAGLNTLLDAPMSLPLQLAIIATITSVATISVVTGLKHGIRRLSEFNIALAGLILLFVVVAGPTVVIMETFTSGLGNYLQNLPRASLRVGAATDSDWQADWTLFYWAWWISWSPFVGIFAARISRGRTVREMIGGMLLAPTLLGFFWFAAFGGTALEIEQAARGRIADLALEDEALSIYAMLAAMPWPMLTSALATLAIVVFFITSSDSGSLVDVMVTSGGHPNPPRPYRVFWCVTEGVVAGVLLYSGGLLALRTASLIPALPMAVFLVVACYGLVRVLRVDHAQKGRPALEDIAPPGR